MAIKVLVNGARGKMGSLAAEAIQKDAQLTLAGTADIDSDLQNEIRKSGAEVVVDLTRASAVFENARKIIEAGARPVIGTSGLVNEQVAELSKLCREKGLGGIVAPNFSLSVILMQRFAREAARYFSHVEIIEMHNSAKEESPSGTAIRTAEIIAESSEGSIKAAPSKEILPSARGAKHREIPLHSIRLPGYNAHQEIVFGGNGETLSLRSDVINREAYMPGICLACKEVIKLSDLIYGLESL